MSRMSKEEAYQQNLHDMLDVQRAQLEQFTRIADALQKPVPAANDDPSPEELDDILGLPKGILRLIWQGVAEERKKNPNWTPPVSDFAQKLKDSLNAKLEEK